MLTKELQTGTAMSRSGSAIHACEETHFYNFLAASLHMAPDNTDTLPVYPIPS
jgi:hypothetical protein